MAVTNDEAAEKAWDEWVDTHPDILDDEHAVFVDGFAAGRASRDAENEKLRTAENLLAMNALQMSQSTPMSLN